MNRITSTFLQVLPLKFRSRATAQFFTIVAFMGSLALSGFIVSPVWAGPYGGPQASTPSIHLTGVSIQIGPGGFHLGIGGPYYGPYVLPQIHVRPLPRPYYYGYSHHYGFRRQHVTPQRSNHRHGGKFGGNRENFRGGHSRRDHRH